jgi:ribosome-binding protein aMBF1 (putative translation factor)
MLAYKRTSDRGRPKFNNLYGGMRPNSKMRAPKKSASQLSIDFGRYIAQNRKRVGLTQEKLGHAIGTTQSVIARIESGRHNITLKRIDLIAKALGKKLKISID